MGAIWDALIKALVQLFSAMTRGASMLDNLAKAGENMTIAAEKHSRSLIPSDEQLETILEQASENRDVAIDNKAAVIAEAKAKLEAAKAKRDAAKGNK